MPPTLSRKGIARRQEILDRAIEVFAVKGAEGTSLRAIAESIGVSHAALLHYFSSREVLLLEVLREHEARRADSTLDGSVMARVFPPSGRHHKPAAGTLPSSAQS